MEKIQVTELEMQAKVADGTLIVNHDITGTVITFKENSGERTNITVMANEITALIAMLERHKEIML